MNRKLIAMAIAAVVAAPAAMANNVTMYGKVHVDVAYNSNINKGGTAPSSNSNYTVDSNASRLGVKGSEDLGNGLKAIWQMEFSEDMTGSGGISGGSRNTFLGLSGDFGTVLAGRHDTPAKMAFYSVGNDVIGDSVVDLNRVASAPYPNGNGKETFTEVRASKAIAYVSPSMSGFTAAAAIVAGQGTTGTNNGLANAYSLAVMYHGGGLKAAVAYEKLGKEYLGKASDQGMWQAEASYKMGPMFFGANYEKDTNYGGTTNLDRTAWALVGKYSMGNNYVMANYGKTHGDTGIAAAGLPNADGYGLGVGHKFSKRTQVYLAYHETSYSDMNNPSSIALGMIHTF